MRVDLVKEIGHEIKFTDMRRGLVPTTLLSLADFGRERTFLPPQNSATPLVKRPGHHGAN